MTHASCVYHMNCIGSFDEAHQCNLVLIKLLHKCAGSLSIS